MTTEKESLQRSLRNINEIYAEVYRAQFMRETLWHSIGLSIKRTYRFCMDVALV